MATHGTWRLPNGQKITWLRKDILRAALGVRQ